MKLRAGLKRLQTGLVKLQMGLVRMQAGLVRLQASLVRVQTGLVQLQMRLVMLLTGPYKDAGRLCEVTGGLGDISYGPHQVAGGACKLAERPCVDAAGLVRL